MLLTTENIADNSLELFARRILLEIKKYFADEEVQKEFSEWKAISKQRKYRKLKNMPYN